MKTHTCEFLTAMKINGAVHSDVTDGLKTSVRNGFVSGRAAALFYHSDSYLSTASILLRYSCSSRNLAYARLFPQVFRLAERYFPLLNGAEKTLQQTGEPCRSGRAPLVFPYCRPRSFSAADRHHCMKVPSITWLM